MSKSKDESEDAKDEKKKKKEKNVVPTKVIVRRLPPGLTEEEFWKTFINVPPHDYFRFVSGDRTLAPNNFCRAYFNFACVDDIMGFRDRFDGLEVDKSGTRCHCIVEYAPFQKVPKKARKKEDSKANTIEQDSDYVKFLESLETEEEKDVLDVEKYLDELDKREKQYSENLDTPLTSFLKQKREERKKQREERKRQDIERRRKKDEERRRRRDLERKKRLEAEKSKKKKETSDDSSMKKTLAETNKNEKSRPQIGLNKANHGDDSSKLKILQKDGGDQKSQSSTKHTNDKHEGKEQHHKDGKTKMQRDVPPRWKDDDSKSHPRKGDRSYDGGKREDKYKGGSASKKPDRLIYRPGSPRGRGSYRPSSGPGRDSRPQKYSEQRSRNANKSESEQ